MKDTPNQKQTKIFRKMSVTKKLKIVDDFYKFARKLQQDKNPEVRVSLGDQDNEIKNSK